MSGKFVIKRHNDEDQYANPHPLDEFIKFGWCLVGNR